MVKRVNITGADGLAKAAADAEGILITEFVVKRDAFRIVAPCAAQIAAAEKNRRSDARPVIQRKPLNP